MKLTPRWAPGLHLIVFFALFNASTLGPLASALAPGHEAYGREVSLHPAPHSEASARAPHPPVETNSNGQSTPVAQSAYGKLPFAFEASQGQTESQVECLSRGSGHSLFFTPTEAVLVLRKSQEARGEGLEARGMEDPNPTEQTSST